jgi:hypothetical protein
VFLKANSDSPIGKQIGFGKKDVTVPDSAEGQISDLDIGDVLVKTSQR